MEAHAPLPDRQYLQRMAEVVPGFVKQAVAQTATDDDPEHAVEQNVLDILALPAGGRGNRGKRLVLEAANAQQQKQAKGDQIGQSIPVHGQRAELDGNRVKLGIHQHGRHCAAVRSGQRQPGWWNRTYPRPCAFDYTIDIIAFNKNLRQINQITKTKLSI